MEKHFKYQFAIVMFLMFLIGISSIYFLANNYFTTKDMYEHPYRVSNELKKFEISVQKIHLASSVSENIDFRKVGQQDAANRGSLKNIATFYLGKTEDVDNVIQLYEQWLSLRVYARDITLPSSSDDEENVFNKLILAVNKLSTFADNKAAELYEKAKNDALFSAIYIGISLIAAGIVAAFLFWRAFKDLREIAANRKQYRFLIDQNVMIAAINDEGKIFEISNHLSRYLSMTKEDLINHQIRDVFFAGDDSLFNEMWQDVTSGATWNGEIKLINEGESKWIGIDVLPMQGSDYSYSGFRLLARDITNRKSLEHISITDTLTGLLNRRTLDDTLDRATRIAQRNKEPVTIAMLDVDFFKQYNDTYGHAAGDNVLTGIAEVFSGMLARANDFVFRVGGEEFVIIFNSKDVASSKEYIDKIRQAVRDLEIVHEKSTVDSCITISIGCVFFDGKGATDGQLLLSDADANLYRAKEKRNHSVQTVLGKPVVVDIEAKA